MKANRGPARRATGSGPRWSTRGGAVLERVAARFGHRFAFAEHLIGGAAIDATGEPAPDGDARRVRARRRGAPRRRRRPEVGRPAREGAARAGAPRRSGARSGLYANLRPVRVHPALAGASPLKADRLAGRRHPLRARAHRRPLLRASRASARRSASARARSTRSSTPTRRSAASCASRSASRRGRRKLVTSVDKANVLESSRLWREVADRGRAPSSPSVRSSTSSSTRARCVSSRRRASFDVVVTENMFGDILTDEAAVLAGSLGLLAERVARRGHARPLRADPRLGARHRGQGHREPARHDPERGDAAPALARPRRRGARGRAAVDAAITGGARTADMGTDKPISTSADGRGGPRAAVVRRFGLKRSLETPSRAMSEDRQEDRLRVDSNRTAPALGLVDPDLEQARGRDVAVLLAELVGLAHAGRQGSCCLRAARRACPRARRSPRRCRGCAAGGRCPRSTAASCRPSCAHARRSDRSSRRSDRLLVEEQVVVAEVWAAHVPVEVLRLDVKREHVGEEHHRAQRRCRVSLAASDPLDVPRCSRMRLLWRTLGSSCLSFRARPSNAHVAVVTASADNRFGSPRSARHCTRRQRLPGHTCGAQESAWRAASIDSCARGCQLLMAHREWARSRAAGSVGHVPSRRPRPARGAGARTTACRGTRC